MNSKFTVDMPKDRSSIIKVIGVGGGGSNAVNHMFRQGIVGVDFFVCNTDSQALAKSPVPNKIQIGTSLTQGLGAGSKPEVGKQAAIESIEHVIDLLGVSTKMIFLTAGMGGGTGTGAAPVIARTAKELGILTVAIVTTPFAYEGPRRKEAAEIGVAELKECVDSLLIISNDRIKEMYGSLPITKAFSHADNVLLVAAKGIAEIITIGGDMNVDFEDVKTAMLNSGVAIMGNGAAEGEARAIEAAAQALNSPLLNDNQISGAQHILINISWGDEEPLMDEITAITEYFQERAGMNANLKWGYCQDISLERKISVTIIATGFERKENIPRSTTSSRTVHNFPVGTEGKQEVPPQPTLFEQPEPEVSKPQVVSKIEIAPMDEDIERLKKRIQSMKQLREQMQSSEGSRELYETPTYMRKEVKLDDVPDSSEQQISRFYLYDEPGRKPEIRQNNSFLHDNVD